jgi:hypothetical protein
MKVRSLAPLAACYREVHLDSLLAHSAADLWPYHIGRVGVRGFRILVTDDQEQGLCHGFPSASSHLTKLHSPYSGAYAFL